MQTMWRKWHGSGLLLVALLAVTMTALGAVAVQAATPSLPPNQWTQQTATGSLATRVQAMGVMPAPGSGTNGAVRLDIGTWGGGYSGSTQYDNLGVMQYTGTAGQPNPAWTANDGSLPQHSDFHCIVSDYNGSLLNQFVAVSGVPAGAPGAQDGLYVWTSATGSATNVTAGQPMVNSSVTWVAVDPSQNAAAGTNQTHVVYFGTHNGGVYRYDGSTFTALPNYPQDPYALNVNQLVVIPASPAVGSLSATPLTLFVATEGYGILKGTCSTADGTGAWTWAQVNTGLSDLNVLSIAAFYNTASTNYWNNPNKTLEGQNAIYAGTLTGGLFMSTDLSTWQPVLVNGSAISAPVTSILAQYAPVGSGNGFYDLGYLFAGTNGQGVFRLNEVTGQWQAINQVTLGSNTYDLIDSNVYALAGYFDNATSATLPVFYLFAGTADATGAGNVWAIALTAPSVSNAWFASSTYTYVSGQGAFFAGLTGSPSYQLDGGTSYSPQPWTPKLYNGVNPAPPAGLSVAYQTDVSGNGQVWLQGSPLDCAYGGGILIADALGNWFDWEASSSTAFTVDPTVSISASPTEATTGQPIAFSATIQGAQGTYPANLIYAWTFGDGGTSTQPAPTHVYTTAGPYTVNLSITDNSCTSPITVSATAVTVTVNNALAVAPSIAGQSGSMFQLQSGTTGGVAPYPITYNWGDNSSPTSLTWNPANGPEPVATHYYQATGSYPVTVTVADSNNPQATVSVTMTVNYTGGSSSVLFYSSPNPVPANGTVTFTMQQVSTGAGQVAYTVDFGDGTPAYTSGCITAGTPNTTTHTYNTANMNPGYTVTLTADNSTCGNYGNLKSIQTLTQKVYVPFTAVALAQTSGPCSDYTNQAVSFSITPAGGLAPYRYVVSWGDGSMNTYLAPSSAAYPVTHTYATAGTYPVGVTATDCQAGVGTAVTQTSNTSVTIYTPVSAIQASVIPPAQQVTSGSFATVTLKGAVPPGAIFSPGATWQFFYTAPGGTATAIGSPSSIWGNLSAGVNFTTPAVITYPSPYAPVSYLFTLVVNDGTCASNLTTTASALFYAPLTVTAPGWSTSCTTDYAVDFNAGGSTLVSGGVPGYTYVWHFGDGVDQTTTGPTASHVYAAAGTYTVVLTVNDSIGNTTNVNFNVKAIGHISYTVTPQGSSAVTGQNFAFTVSNPTGGTGAGFRYSWSFSPATVTYASGSTSASQNPVVIFSAPGSYTATVTVSDVSDPVHFTCSQSVPVTVYPALDCSQFTVTPTSTSFPIPFNDTFTTTWQGGVAPYNLTYTFTRIKDADGNPVNDPPQTVNQTGVTGTSYQETFNFQQAGTWTVQAAISDSYTPTAESCTSNLITVQALSPTTLGVTTNATPLAGTAPLTVAFSCVPTGGVTPYSYSWSFGDSANSTSNQQNPSFVYTQASYPNTITASVTVTDSTPVANGGPQVKTSYITITVYAPLTVAASLTSPSSGTGMAGSTSFVFAAAPTGGNGTYSYLWNFGDGGTSTNANPSHVFNNAGTYSVTVTVNDTASHTATSNTILVTVYPSLTVTAAATPTIIYPTPGAVTMTANAVGGDGNYSYTYVWGDGTTDGPFSGPLASSHNHQYASAGTFSAYVKVVDGLGNIGQSTPVAITAYNLLTASIAADNTSGVATNGAFTVNFTPAVSGGNGTYTYNWNFGDGGSSSSSAATVSHAYAPGTYSATLTVSDSASHVATSNTVNITVYAPLTLSASGSPLNLVGPGNVAFNAIVAGGNGNYTVTWNFGDGSTGTGLTANHSYAVGTKPNFSYTVTVTATDSIGGTGHTANATLTVVVMPVPPTITSVKKVVPPTVPSFRLRVYGSNFQSGITATINRTPVTVNFKNSGEIVLMNCKSLCPKGVPVAIVLTNPDGGVSAPFQFVR